MSKLKVFDKLVRDGIPEIIKSQGRIAFYHVAGSAEFIRALKAKLIEEASELKEAKTRKDILEELVDVTQVCEDLMRFFKITNEELHKKRIAKKKKKGGFDKRLILERAEV